MLKKYLSIIKIEISRQFTYRVNIVAFVFGNLFELMAQVVVWTAVFKTLDVVKGYSYEEMMTYVVVGWFFMFVTTNYRFENNIARDVREGTLSNFISKPISYAKYTVAKSLGRVFIAFLVVLMQGLFCYLLFSEYIQYDLSIKELLVLLLMLVNAYFIKLFLAILIGFVSFWTLEVKGFYNSINILMKFLSGGYFPINLMPTLILNISLVFPFAYTFFFPALFYLGKYSFNQALVGLAVQYIGIFILYLLIKLVWHKGAKQYEGVGI